ncbi:MAG: transglycosylase SLT domain-containing protein [Pseudomonadota bacterium]|nr:transglycosylase SLT domain-containing protein [Pseudomonadota bacterium]
MDRLVFVIVMNLFFASTLGALASAVLSISAHARTPDLCEQYRATLTRESQALFGIGAPVPALMAQIRQESSCQAGITAWDNGRGLAQFMDPTARQVSKSFPELGAPDPYNPKWAMRAMVRYDYWLHQRVRGDTECDRWAASFKSYNAGLGYVQRAQRLSPAPGTWFNVTENINAGQSEKNFVYSRHYPRVILFTHQMRYVPWGPPLCLGVRH